MTVKQNSQLKIIDGFIVAVVNIDIIYTYIIYLYR